MKLIAMPSNIAEKIAGRLNNGQDEVFPIYVGKTNNGTEWYVLPVLDELKALPGNIKAKARTLIDDGTIKVFDTEDTSDPITKKYLALQSAKLEEAEALLATRTIKWDTKKEITL